MTEIERLRADLVTLEKAKEVAATIDGGFSDFRFRTLIDSLKQKIAELEAQQAPEDEWADSRIFVQEILADSSFPQRLIWLARYARHLESKVSQLEEEINTSEFTWMATHAARLLKERDNALAKVAELDHELRCERIDGGKVSDDRKAIDAEKNREKLAELTTIANAIPPACGLAKELVQKRIEGVKREIQNNG